MERLEDNFISNNKYLVRFASTEEEVRQAQRLRFNVFNIELGEGLSGSYSQQLDIDEFDKQCHHLLVIEKASGEVIGTYRMQTYETAKQNLGYCTDREFDLSGIPTEILKESVEVGRACIEEKHRNGRVLFFLWRGLAKYMLRFNCRYLLGCCSLTSQIPQEAWNVQHYLQNEGYMHDNLMVSVRDEYRCRTVEPNIAEARDTTLPKLFRLYMDLGAKVCSPPALDSAFKTIDYLVLLDIEALDERARLLFFN